MVDVDVAIVYADWYLCVAGVDYGCVYWPGTSGVETEDSVDSDFVCGSVVPSGDSGE